MLPERLRVDIARAVLGRLPGAEMLNTTSALVIYHERRWTGRADMRENLEVMCAKLAANTESPAGVRVDATALLVRLVQHPHHVPIVFLLPDSTLQCDFWPPSDVMAARGLS